MSITPRQEEAYIAWVDCGESFTEGAKSLSIGRQAFTELVKKVILWKEASPGQKEAVKVTGLGIQGAKHGWRIIQHNDGSKDSVFWKQENIEFTPEDIMEEIKSALSEIGLAIPLIIPTEQNISDTVCVFPVADLHVGLLTDEEEVGVDWDTKKAMTVFEKTFGKLVGNTPNASTAYLAQLGDLTHTDDQQNVTPQSKHQLDVDSRYFMVVRRAIMTMK